MTDHSKPETDALTESEILILNYVDACLGGPDSIKRSMRQLYLSLIERGLIEPVTSYRLTDSAHHALKIMGIEP